MLWSMTWMFLPLHCKILHAFSFHTYYLHSLKANNMLLLLAFRPTLWSKIYNNKINNDSGILPNLTLYLIALCNLGWHNFIVLWLNTLYENKIGWPCNHLTASCGAMLNSLQFIGFLCFWTFHYPFRKHHVIYTKVFHFTRDDISMFLSNMIFLFHTPPTRLKETISIFHMLCFCPLYYAFPLFK